LPIGGLTVGGLAMFMLTRWGLSWRLFMAACSIPSLLGLILVYYFVPESARYLAVKGRFEDATNEANYIAQAMGYRGDILTVDELQHHFSQNERHLKNSVTYYDAFKEADTAFRYLYFSNLKSSTLILQILWFCLGFALSFGPWMLAIFEEVHIHRTYFALFFFWVANVPGLLAAGILIDKIGRKFVLLGSTISTAISLLFFAGAAHMGADNSDFGILVTSFVFHAFLVMSWTATGVLTSETFPTKVRTTGIGVCTASLRVAIILAQYIDGLLISNPSKLIAISIIPVLVAYCSIHYLDDTSNQELKDDLEQIELSDMKQNQSNSQTSFMLLDNLNKK